MKLRFVREHCIGCKLCQLACSGVKEAVFNPLLARLFVTSYYSRGQLRVEARVCTLCGACTEACPTGALVFENERLKFDPEACTSCNICVDRCPEKVITPRPEGVAVCDLCAGDPSCVKWCPHGALVCGEVA